MNSDDAVLTQDAAGATTGAVSASSRVPRSTYASLSLTLIFSAGAAAATASLGLPYPDPILPLLGYFGLVFLTTRSRNRAPGLVFVFALTGFMGYTLGPIVDRSFSLSNGHQVVTVAMVGAATIFLALAAFALVSRRSFGSLARLPDGRRAHRLPGVGSRLHGFGQMGRQTCMQKPHEAAQR